jgi:hypothetical protein
MEDDYYLLYTTAGAGWLVTNLLSLANISTIFIY